MGCIARNGESLKEKVEDMGFDKLRVCQNCKITEAEIGDEFEELDYKGSGEWVCSECADNLRAECDEVNKNDN